MLSIRMQRLGKKGYPVYRVIVQDSRQSPASGKFVAMLGSYNPHTKETSVAKDKAEHYLKHGAQPSDRVIKLFREEKITLPKWVNKPVKQKKEIRNPEKLRKNRPAGAPAPEKPKEEEPAEDKKPADEKPEADKPAADTEAPKDEPEAKPAEENKPDEQPTEEAKDQPAGEQPAEDKKPESETKEK